MTMCSLPSIYKSCCCWVAKSCLTLWPHGQQHARLPVLHCLPEFAQICVHWVSDAVQLAHPLLPPPFDFHLSQHQGLFQWVSSSHLLANVLELQLSISPSSKYSGLISFRIGWFDLLAVQGTLKSLLQQHHSKASILLHSAFLWSKSHLCPWLLRKP